MKLIKQIKLYFMQGMSQETLKDISFLVRISVTGGSFQRHSCFNSKKFQKRPFIVMSVSMFLLV